MHQAIAVARMAASLILSNNGESHRAEETAVHIGRTFGCEIDVIALSRGVQTVLIAVVAVFFRAQIAPKPLSLKNSLFGRGVFIMLGRRLALWPYCAFFSGPRYRNPSGQYFINAIGGTCLGCGRSPSNS